MSGLLDLLAGAPLRALGQGLRGLYRGTRMSGGDFSALKTTSKDLLKTITHPVHTTAKMGKNVGHFYDEHFLHYLRGDHGVKNPLLRTSDALIEGSIGTVAKVGGTAIKYGVGVPLEMATMAASATGMGALRAVHGLMKMRILPNAAGRNLYGFSRRLVGNLAVEGVRGAYQEGKMATNLLFGTGRMIWKARNSATAQWGFGLGMVGTAAAVGGLEGSRNATMGQMLPYDKFAATFTNPQEVRHADQMLIPGESMRASIDNFGATGDLVFALNNLRKDGMF